MGLGAVLLGGCVDRKHTAADSGVEEPADTHETGAPEYDIRETAGGAKYYVDEKEYFVLNDGRASIIDIPEGMAEFKCPDTLEGCPVNELYFSSFENLDSNLTKIDVSDCSSLRRIRIAPYEGMIPSAPPEHTHHLTLVLGERNRDVKQIWIEGYGLEQIQNLEVCTSLEILELSNNRLEQLDVGCLVNLEFLSIEDNPVGTEGFDAVDVSSNERLGTIIANKNQTVAGYQDIGLFYDDGMGGYIRQES
jgi:hypothetical protein